MATIRYTVPGLERGDAEQVVDILQHRLHALNDLQLTLKHVHWNVVGPNFIAVHEMLDPQVDAVRGFVDDVAERIATLGGSPNGTPGALVKGRPWDDYSIGRDQAIAHLGALDVVYTGVISDHRTQIEKVGALDPVIRSELQAELLSIFRELKKTVIVVTHDLNEAAFFADDVILMHSGAII